MAEYIATAALALLAIFVMRGAYVAHRKLACLHDAQARLELIAAVAHDIENDPEAPASARDFAEFIADRVFDRKFQAHLLSMVRNSSTDNSMSGRAISEKTFGKKYGNRLYEASKAFGVLCYLAQPHLIRRMAISQTKRAAKEFRNGQTRSLINEFCGGGSYHNDFSGGPNAKAA